MDVCTLGLREVAATPVENAMDNNRGYIVVETTHAKNSDNLDSIEIFDANAESVYKRNELN